MDQQTKAALKQNDAFVTTTSHGLEWASENRKSVIVTVSLLLLVIVIIVLAGVFYNKRSNAASVAFGSAMQAYQTPIAAPGQQVPPGVKTFASVPDRAKAANDLFMACANQYNMTPDGKVCRYFGGLTYIEQGQNGPAEDALKSVASGWNSDLGALAKLSLAQLYRGSNRDPQAIEIYNQLAAKPTTTVPAGLAKLQLADLYTSEGKVDQAKKIYAELKDKDAKGAAGLIAAQKLNPTAPAGPGAQQQ
ncbi:tetratricopeptide repeat protein [Granulicella arctica]|uniref:tetratricopeptide repeat protein n=1 Tax=Granulicella arctica TaxID=940613 RepID=UPI0021E02D62|nr:tetratricopeptide repeat protein [Granulicella arctica]